jgi:aminoglycoside phosphotransferase family enzyme/predicted kinase
MSSNFPEYLAGLLQPEAYPHPVEAVTLVETHISWVLLTGAFAYKVKRPVRFPFVDLTSLQRRAFFCAEEVRLNRRFAPDLYLEVCPITVTDGAVRMGGGGAPVEYAVRMLQFQRDEELDTLLAQERILPAELGAFGQELAGIHARLPVAEPASPWGEPQAIQAMIRKNLEECAEASGVFEDASEVSSLRLELERQLEVVAPWMAERRRDGRVRECHGDLHAANIVRRGSTLVAFDCIEFEPAFRWIDVAEEIAFLLADLDARGFPQHEQAFLGGYLARSGDFQACRLLSLHKAHRALVRAKVTALTRAGAAVAASADPKGRALHRAYIDCATLVLVRRYPTLILMSGFSGSGKTWLAERLAPLLGAVHLRSDVERKRLMGLAELERSNSALGEGMYSKSSTSRVYHYLASAVEDVLVGGYTAIVDATFARREDRSIFRELARRLSVAACLIECRAPDDVLLRRVSERDLQRKDASEANVAVLDWQREHWEPVAADELWAVMGMDTTQPDLDGLARRIRMLQG